MLKIREFFIFKYDGLCDDIILSHFYIIFFDNVIHTRAKYWEIIKIISIIFARTVKLFGHLTFVLTFLSAVLNFRYLCTWTLRRNEVCLPKFNFLSSVLNFLFITSPAVNLFLHLFNPRT